MPPPEGMFTGRQKLRLVAPVAEALATLVRSRGTGFDDLKAAVDALVLTGGPGVGSIDLTSLADKLDDLDSTGLRVTPVVTSIPQPTLVALEDRAIASPRGLRNRLLSYWLLDTRVGGGRLSLLRELNSPNIPAVEYAYLEPGLSDPTVKPAQNPLSVKQGYLEPAPAGVDAYDAWRLGWSGAGVGFVDLEMGWDLTHVDLVDHLHDAQVGGAYGAGDERDMRFFNDSYLAYPTACGYAHGTNVLGIVVGVDNTCGVIGLAPSATASVVSRYRHDTAAPAKSAPAEATASADFWQVDDAIAAAIDPARPRALQKGDVLLLEVQTADKRPIEVVSDYFDAIQLAVGQDVIVIEAAGNGGMSLDGDTVGWENPTDPTPQVLNRNAFCFTDSGAIMVAAAQSGTGVVGTDAKGAFEGHGPYASSNYGSRVDCYAWGENVVTTGQSNSTSQVFFQACGAAGANSCQTQYTEEFNATSAASAIVAGCAVLVQEMSGKSLGPDQMREILSGPGRLAADNLERVPNGTGYLPVADADGKVKQIGVMPDLAAIVNDPQVSGAADPYVRDSYEDIGLEPSPGAFQSPDILIRNVSAANAQGMDPFAAEPANPTTPLPNDLVTPGPDNHVFVRVHNASPVAADGTRVRVFWSEVATLLTSDKWNELVAPANAPFVVDVPGDGTGLVAVPWDATQPVDRPISGHGCFVAVVDHDQDPAPPLIDWSLVGPGDPQFWSLFKGWVSAHNNVAWRNFNVVGDPAELSGLVWFLRGAPDRARTFELIIEHTVPEPFRVWWVFPGGLAGDVARAGARRRTRSIRQDAAGIPLDEPRLRLEPVRLARGADLPCRFIVRPRGGQRGRRPRLRSPAMIRIRQLHRGNEVGRVTWVIVPRDDE